MGRILRLRLSEVGGAWRIGLEPLMRSTIPRDLEGEALASARARIDEARAGLRKAPGAGPLVASRDAAVTAAEEALGRALAQLVFEHGPAAAELGRALALGRTAVVAVDTHDAHLGDLPWELLAGPQAQGGLEAEGAALVVRLTDGPAAAPTPPARARVRSVVVAEPADDPEVRRLAQAIDHALAEHALAPATPHFEGVEPDDLVVVHLVAHGTQSDGLFSLAGSGDGASTLMARLRPLDRADLVVVSICHGGAAAEVTAALPGRLLRAGARACVSPRGVVRTAAAEAFIGGLYRGLAEGADLAVALAAGRRAVRARGWPHPDGRWSLFGLTVGDLGWLATPPRLEVGWRPAGWPRPGPAAAALLTRCRERAQDAGYVGIEHLVMALATADGLSFRLRSRCEAAAAAAAEFLARLGPARGPVDWSGTPALRALGAALSPEFTVATVAALVDDLRHPLSVLLPAGGRPAYSSSPETEEAGSRPVGAPIALEVLLGPEGGRRLPATPGATVGRWDPDRPADQALYRACPVVDEALSRAALRWDDQGLIALKGSTSLEIMTEAPFRLGRFTWLVVRSDEP